MEEEIRIEETTPTGRDKLLEAYRNANPDNSEPDDNSLYDFSNNRFSELEGRYNELNGANTRLAELVSKDPKLGAVLSMITGDNPKSFPYAVASVYGKDVFNLEGDALDDFEKGYQENLIQLANSEKEREQAMKNIQEYNNTLIEYGKEKSLTEEQISEVHNGIMQLADDILMGKISKNTIDWVYKGLNYETDIKEAIDTGFVEGKNTVAEAKMKEKTQPNVIPDFGNATGKGTVRKLPPVKKGSFYDNFKES